MCLSIYDVYDDDDSEKDDFGRISCIYFWLLGRKRCDCFDGHLLYILASDQFDYIVSVIVILLLSIGVTFMMLLFVDSLFYSTSTYLTCELAILSETILKIACSTKVSEYN